MNDPEVVRTRDAELLLRHLAEFVVRGDARPPFVAAQDFAPNHMANPIRPAMPTMKMITPSDVGPMPPAA